MQRGLEARAPIVVVVLSRGARNSGEPGAAKAALRICKPDHVSGMGRTLPCVPPGSSTTLDRAGSELLPAGVAELPVAVDSSHQGPPRAGSTLASAIFERWPLNGCSAHVTWTRLQVYWANIHLPFAHSPLWDHAASRREAERSQHRE